MKRLTLTLLTACFAVLSLQTVSAQDDLSGPKGIERKNVIKINPISPVLKNYFFGYERVINDKFSAQLTLGITSAKAANLPIIGNEIGVIELDDQGYTTFDAGAITLKGTTIMPEFRWYLSNKRSMPRGFYFGPYIRYQSHTLAAPGIEFSGTDTIGGMPVQVDTTLFNAFDIKMSSFGAGLTWGWQAMIGNRVTFEWNMGAGFKSSKLDLPSQTLKDPITGEEEDVFGDLEKEGNDILDVAPVGLRFGFTLGVAF